MDFNHQKSQK